MQPLLEKYFFSLVKILCGDLQDNVADSATHDLAEITSAFSEVLNMPMQGPEHPAIWGPGLSKPPGGPDYRNR